MDEQHISDIRSWLEQRYGALTSFERIPSTQEGKAYYDVARVTAGGRRMIAKWSSEHPESRAHLRKEFDASGFLTQHGIPTAAPISYDERLPLFTMEELSGRCCTPADMHAQNASAAGSLLRAFHALPAVSAPPTVERWAGGSLAEELAIRMRKWEGEGESVFPGEWTGLRQIFDSLLTQVPDQRGRVVVRRDIHEENWFLLDAGGLAAIDHAHLTVASAANDLWKAPFSLLPTEEARRAFRAAYGAEAYDAATAPAVTAAFTMVHLLSTVTWIRRTVPRPKLEAIWRERLRTALGEV